MVILSDRIEEFLAELDAQDRQGNAGTIYYLKELADENRTYPSGKGVNLLARSGNSVGVINGMSTQTESPSIEIWLFGGTEQDKAELLDYLWEKYAGMECDFHTMDSAFVAALEQRGARTYDETLEYVGQGLEFQLCGEIHKLSVDEMSLLSNSKDDQLAMYCGELPLNSNNCHVYGKLNKTNPITICTIEENYNGFVNLVEPIWVYTSRLWRRKGLASKCLNQALYGTRENAVILYHAEEGNKASAKLATKIGLSFNNKCMSLAVKL